MGESYSVKNRKPNQTKPNQKFGLIFFIIWFVYGLENLKPNKIRFDLGFQMLKSKTPN